MEAGAGAERYDPLLVCPSCRSKLIRGAGGKICCSSCNACWRDEDGVAAFIENDYYWGEPAFTRDVLRSIIDEMKRMPWHDVIKNHDLKDVREAYKFLTNDDRIKWADLLDLPKDSVVLDLGAGMGTISDALSRRFGTIYAVEPVKERTAFISARFRQDGRNNIRVIRSDIDNLPIPQGSLDLIVLNGVLEWLPFSKRELSPRDAQLYYLRLLRKLLKKNGSIYIGIENRTGYYYFGGAKDPHVDIPYVTVLPRTIADMICRRKLGDIYRPYIYSCAGYKKLLKQAGFENIRLFGAYPSYNDPQHLIDLKDKNAAFENFILSPGKKSNRILEKFFSKIGILKYLGYAYVILAETGERT